MARRCEICGKGTATGYSISHSHVRSKRRFRANLQRIRGVVDGRVRRITVCTSCLTAGKVRRAG
ncbi:MAG: 50S ribosomal protein L28 [Armatimonadota bacterium]|nr:50S ribosomal protein L28 [Armatimonadota bacterium]MDR7447621.1 50S ribosomal protein L28 [Armatimonadota bacterium]MDR7459498.1 50S ribosomal protein L28 [Armatimonadota bacterium]MDR7480476.1 50S ribosomal protein L28 [Armatimonadota bacterium]MDR7488811.1 50S ribosomal protein L28 [Armatimonadota bacterium]